MLPVARFFDATGVCLQRPRTVLAKLHGFEAGERVLPASERRAYRTLGNFRNCAGAMIGSITGGKVGWLLDQLIQRHGVNMAQLVHTFKFPFDQQMAQADVSPFFTSLFAAMSSVYWNHPNGGDLKGLCRDIELSVARRLANSGDWLQQTARRWSST